MLGRDRIVRRRHLEEHTPILKQRGARMFGEKLFQQQASSVAEIQFSRNFHLRYYQPMRADNWVTWAVWWRPCQS